MGKLLLPSIEAPKVKKWIPEEQSAKLPNSSPSVNFRN
jgi:hypothetical protein